FHGCLFHGCPDCYPDNREEKAHPLTHQSLEELYALTLKKRSYIQGLGMKYVCIWEHDYRHQLDRDPDLKTYVDQLDLAERLDPRDSFFGGRTNASQLRYNTAGEEQIKYVDFTSLYPWVNKYAEYPVGHPKIITKDFDDLSEYFGIAKVKVLPPRQLYHPVLPYRSNGKLKFPLCRTCADIENPDQCTCTDEERMLTGTWCTPELLTAVRLGYTIVTIYEVYHWETTTQYNPDTREGGLFAHYINTFLKFKQEASGPPEWIQSQQDLLTYIQQYFEKEGVSMDAEKIAKNPGLRALAKLCLNSFWGKFGQRLNMRQTSFFHEVEANQFFQIFTDPMKEPQNFHILTNDIIQLEWAYKTESQPEDNKTNIYLATFTTCWARLKLYSVLEQVNRRVLYYDTDSVIYVSKPGESDPPLGDFLGDLTSELPPSQFITQFVSLGPKNYGYRTNTGQETCKVRGFTLNFTNSQLINLETMDNLLTDPQHTAIAITNPHKICRDKRKRKLYNREEQKTYQMVYTKRRKIDNYDTEPFGY
ncbi:MAG: DNA polymerase, partial [Sedimenticola sp.]